jgi:hypothetical protein
MQHCPREVSGTTHLAGFLWLINDNINMVEDFLYTLGLFPIKFWIHERNIKWNSTSKDDMLFRTIFQKKSHNEPKLSKRCSDKKTKRDRAIEEK